MGANVIGASGKAVVVVVVMLIVCSVLWARHKSNELRHVNALAEVLDVQA